MHKLFKSLHKRHDLAPSSQNLQIPKLPAAFYFEQDIYRYRKLRGVNLGSWFVLEPWITPSVFRKAVSPAQSDRDIAKGQNAKAILSEHWSSWITEDDWRWLHERGVNSVRIPIGYYHLAGVDPSLLEGTDFQGLADVFADAWSKITQAIAVAYKYHIGVLIDLHAAPGKQNPHPHSGTSSQSCSFFSSSHSRNLTSRVLVTLLNALTSFTCTHHPPLPNLIGIELLNEPDPPSDDLLRSWYSQAMRELRKLDSRIPIYLADCWRPDSYASWLVSSNFAEDNSLTALDHHLYRCFTSADIHTPAHALTEALALNHPSSTAAHFSRISESLGQKNAGMVVGEWSGALNPGSLKGSQSNGREEIKTYINTQLRLYETCCAGSFFWTYKKEHSGDVGWSLCDAVNFGTFPQRIGIWLSGKQVDIDHNEIENAGIQQKKVAGERHRQYWSQYSGMYNHALFDHGFDAGWATTLQFLTFHLNWNEPVTELGFIRPWARRCSGDFAHDKCYWEFEHGFEQAVEIARGLFLQKYCS